MNKNDRIYRHSFASFQLQLKERQSITHIYSGVHLYTGIYPFRKKKCSPGETYAVRSHQYFEQLKFMFMFVLLGISSRTSIT